MQMLDPFTQHALCTLCKMEKSITVLPRQNAILLAPESQCSVAVGKNVDMHPRFTALLQRCLLDTDGDRILLKQLIQRISFLGAEAIGEQEGRISISLPKINTTARVKLL